MQRNEDLRQRPAAFGRLAGLGLLSAADFRDSGHPVLPTGFVRFAAEAGPPQRGAWTRQRR